MRTANTPKRNREQPVDYRTRWQQKRRKRHLVQLALIPVVIIGLTLIGLLVRSLTAGKSAWSHTGPAGTIASPIVSGNLVLTTFSNGQIECFRLLDGTRVWPSPFQQPQNLAHSAAVASGIAVASSDYGRIFAISMTDGKLLWSADVDSHLSTAPLVTEDTIYVATAEGHLQALDLQTGKSKFSVSLANALFSTQPALFDDVLILCTSDGTIIGVNANNGTEMWPRRHVAATLLCPVANVNGLAACGSDEGNLYVLAPDTGNIQFITQASGLLRSPAVADEDALYVCDSDGWLYKYRLTDGRRVYAIRLATSVNDGPYVDGAHLLCLVDGDRVLKVRRDNGHIEHAWRGYGNAVNLSVGGDHIVLGTSSGEIDAIQSVPK